MAAFAQTVVPQEEAQAQPESTVNPSNTQHIAIANAWLEWQCRMVAGVQIGCVYQLDNEESVNLLAIWPGDQTHTVQLENLASKALRSGKLTTLAGQMLEAPSDALQDLVAIPVTNHAGRYAVTLQMATRSQSQQDAVVQLVLWGGLWLGSIDNVLSGFSDTGARLSQHLTEHALQHMDLRTACLEAANQLAVDLGCERVSVGFKQGIVIQLQAISQLAGFDQQRQLVRSIEAAMEEAVDQLSIINYSDSLSNHTMVTRAHAQLSALDAGLVACTLPLYCNNSAVGAVTLERRVEQGFDSTAIERCRRALAPMGPVLQLISLEQRSSLSRLRESFSLKIKSIKAPTTIKANVQWAAAALLLLGLLFVPVAEKVSARASIEGADTQVIVAPQEGYISASNARAGDRVTKGQVIASLDDRDLLIEQEKWLGELGKVETSLARALSQRDRSEMGLIQARKAQIDAELALIEQKLERSVLQAPFDGLIVSGDLNKSLGAPVSSGDVLFQLASMENYRLVLDVDEHDVAELATGQPGTLRFSALPGRGHAITTQAIMPVAITVNGKTVFRLEASFDEPEKNNLRPGMNGVAKITVGKQPLLQSWLQGAYSKVQLLFWKIGA